MTITRNPFTGEINKPYYHSGGSEIIMAIDMPELVSRSDIDKGHYFGDTAFEMVINPPPSYVYSPYVPIVIERDNLLSSGNQPRQLNVNMDDPSDDDMRKILLTIHCELNNILNITECTDIALTEILTALLKKKNGNIISDDDGLMVRLFNSRLMMTLMHVMNSANSEPLRRFASTRDGHYAKLLIKHFVFTGLNADVQSILSTFAI